MPGGLCELTGAGGEQLQEESFERMGFLVDSKQSDAG